MLFQRLKDSLTMETIAKIELEITNPFFAVKDGDTFQLRSKEEELCSKFSKLCVESQIDYAPYILNGEPIVNGDKTDAQQMCQLIVQLDGWPLAENFECVLEWLQRTDRLVNNVKKEVLLGIQKDAKIYDRLNKTIVSLLFNSFLLEECFCRNDNLKYGEHLTRIALSICMKAAVRSRTIDKLVFL